MAGSAKPNIVGLRNESEIHLNSSYVRFNNGVSNVYNNISALFDGIEATLAPYGAVLITKVTGNFIDFTCNEPIKIWCIGATKYSDGGGSTPQNIIVEKWNGSGWIAYAERSTNNNGVWYDLTGQLDAGRYKITAKADYVSMDEWYVENQRYEKILLSSENKYYSNKPVEDSTEINLIPKMISNTSPSGVARGSSKLSTNYWEYYAFDGSIDKTSSFFYSWLSSMTTGWLEYQFVSGQVVNKYSLVHGSNLTTTAPKTWEFQGSNDGVNYVTLDKRENITDWILWEKKYFSFENKTPYKIYRINITANNGHAQYVGLQEMEMFFVNRKVRVLIGDFKEKLFIDHGSSKFNPSLICDGYEDVTQKSNALNAGKTLEHTIDMSKRRVDKIIFGPL